jgi:hypothetical protein
VTKLSRGAGVASRGFDFRVRRKREEIHRVSRVNVSSACLPRIAQVAFAFRELYTHARRT